jgi:hypothetical protein
LTWQRKKEKYDNGQRWINLGSLLSEHIKKFPLKHLDLSWRSAHFHSRGGKGGNDMNISEINSDTKPSFMILVADDDPDDRFLLGLVFEELQGVGEMHFVQDGEQLMNYLYRQGEYTDPVLSPQAKLIFLDINMPKKMVVRLL